jgi:NADH-quinone oxidoreductase subunit C
MTDDPNKDGPAANVPHDAGGDEPPPDAAPGPAGGGTGSLTPGSLIEGAGTLPPPPDSAGSQPTPESQAALTGKAPSSNSAAGTTMPASGGEGERPAGSAPAAQASPQPPAAETPEEKKARLERIIAEAKAKKEATARQAAAQAESAGTQGEGEIAPAAAASETEATRREPPGGETPAVADPTGEPTQAERERAAKIAAAKARAAALKEAGAGRTPAAPPAAPTAQTPPGAVGAPKPPVKKKDEGPKPVDASGHPLVARLREGFGAAVLEATTFLRQLSIRIAPAAIVEVCRALRDDAETPFNYLSDLSCVHWPGREGGEFEIVYNLYSITRNERVRLKVSIEAGAGVESVTVVWPAANWMEREVFDLFGVKFDNHPDLRRLLLPEDWQGHPLRKDYPLEAMENEWTTKHLPEFTEVQREQLEQRRAYGLELLSTPDERRLREIFRAGREPMPLERK